MRRISISQRIGIPGILALIFLSGALIYYVFSDYNSLLDQRRESLKQQVELAISFVKANRLVAKLSGERPFSRDKDAFRKLEKVNFGNNNYFYIFEGTVARYHGGYPHFKNKDLKNIIDKNNVFIIRKADELVTRFSEGSLIYLWPKPGTGQVVKVLSYYQRIPGTKLWIGTHNYIDDLEQNFWQNIYLSVFLIAVILIVLSGTTFAVGYSILSPLRSIRKRMTRLAEGDSSSPVPELKVKNEIGDIARALDIFREHKKYAHELDRINTEIEKHALYDHLTGLANKRYFEAHFSHLRQICKQNKESMTLFHLDLDRFKGINDSMGHAAGDFVLQYVADTLQKLTREEDFIARISGDNFVIIGSCPNDADWSEELAEKIIKTFAEPIEFDGRYCRFGVSIGIVTREAEEIHLEELLKYADIALGRAKEKGRNCYEIFSQALEVEVLNRNYAIEEFLDGLDLGQLVPYYQPQFDIHTLDLVGVEVLARWSHPEKGILEPAAFLNIAEDQNVMAKINQAIAVQALQDCNRLIETNIQLPKVSVNFSLDSLKDPGLVQWLDSLMPFPTKLSLELIESIPFEDHDETIMDNLMQIKERGIDIEIDDFGSSHASLLSLLEARPHRLKIDRKIITPIINSEIHRKLLNSVVEMGNSLDVPIIVGGVETLEHLEYIQKLNVDAFQGFAIAAPMKFNDLRIFLKTEAWRKIA